MHDPPEGVWPMASLREIKNAVSSLSRDQLSEFMSWYERFDTEMWDEQIERDAGSGRLDTIADAAIADHAAGRSRRL